MALLLIRIENKDSLPLNEFYDYNGRVYALSRARASSEQVCLDFEDFYDAAIDTDHLTDIPVVFVSVEEETPGKPLTVLGWYQTAEIRQTALTPAFFLEGNIIASAADAVLADPASKASSCLSLYHWMRKDSAYEVVEREDVRYPLLMNMMRAYTDSNRMLRYSQVHIHMDPKDAKDYEKCIENCSMLAERIMTDHCQDIRDIKALETYALQAVRIHSKDADGYYYLAMASYQLGNLRQGLKAIGKALDLEPDAPDLLAQKGYLLTSKEYFSQAADCFRQAFRASGEEDYLLWEGKTWLLGGQVDKGYDCFRRISDKGLLEANGIVLKDMEKKWPFINIRGFKWKDFFRKS